MNRWDICIYYEIWRWDFVGLSVPSIKISYLVLDPRHHDLCWVGHCFFSQAPKHLGAHLISQGHNFFRVWKKPWSFISWDLTKRFYMVSQLRGHFLGSTLAESLSPGMRNLWPASWFEQRPSQFTIADGGGCGCWKLSTKELNVSCH